MVTVTIRHASVALLLLVLAVAALLPGARAAAVTAAEAPQGQGGGRGRGGDPWPDYSRKVLAVADVQSGYHHDSISHALATIEQIGRRSGDYVTLIRTDSQLITKEPIVGEGRYEGRGVNAKTLDFYDAIVMLPSGYGTMSDDQKEALLSFVRDDGKGLVVGHAAGVAFTNWPEWGELVGGYMDSEFTEEATVIVEDPEFPGARAFGALTFLFTDQHPVYGPPYSRDSAHVVLRLDPASLSDANRARREDGDFAVAFAKQYGNGRVFNMGWGHPDATWDHPQFQRFMLGVMRWATGLDQADITPRPLPLGGR